MAAAAEVLVCAGATWLGGRGEQTPPHLGACHRASHLLVSSAVLELQPHPLLRTAGIEPPSLVFSHPQRPAVGTGKPDAVGNDTHLRQHGGREGVDGGMAQHWRGEPGSHILNLLH